MYNPQTASSSTPPPPPLLKHHSWSPDSYRDEAWIRRKMNIKNRRNKSVTEEDLDELKACIELGFSFDSPESDRRLANTLPALTLYYAVNKHYYDSVSKSSPSDCDTLSPLGSHHAIFGAGKGEERDNPEIVKTRLKQWAQAVGCSVRQFSY